MVTHERRGIFVISNWSEKKSGIFVHSRVFLLAHPSGWPINTVMLSNYWHDNDSVGRRTKF